MAKKEKKIYADDGRVIANMNVAGMPWFDGKAEARRRLFGLGPHKGGDRRMDEQNSLSRVRSSRIDKGSVHLLLRSSILASLLIAAVYILAFVVVILLLTSIW